MVAESSENFVLVKYGLSTTINIDKVAIQKSEEWARVVARATSI
jgi:hypothetical protein